MSSSILQTDDLVRTIFDFVRDGADILRFETVSTCWRRVAIDDSLWSERPFFYGSVALEKFGEIAGTETYWDEDDEEFASRNLRELGTGGRRYVLTKYCAEMTSRIMHEEFDELGVAANVLGPRRLCSIVRAYAARVIPLDTWIAQRTYPASNASRFADVQLALSDAAVATIVGIVEDHLVELLERAKLAAVHRSKGALHHDEGFCTSDNIDGCDITVGMADTAFTVGMAYHCNSYHASIFNEVRAQTAMLYHEAHPDSTTEYALTGAYSLSSQRSTSASRRIHHVALPEVNEEAKDRIVRRLLRRAGILACTGAAFEAWWTLFLATLRAIFMSLCKLDTGGEDSDDDDDESYSSSDETPDDGDPTYRGPGWTGLIQSPSRPRVVKPTVALIVHALTTEGLIRGRLSSTSVEAEDRFGGEFSDDSGHSLERRGPVMQHAD